MTIDTLIPNPTQLEAQSLTKPKSGKSWCSVRFSQFFTKQFGESVLNSGYEYTRKKRVLDLIIAPGRIVAKVQTDLNGTTRVEIIMNQLSDDVWNQVFARSASNSLTLAYLLNNELPEEIEKDFDSIESNLFPCDKSEIEILEDGKKCITIKDHVAAAIYKFIERLDENPLHILTLRGRGLEETIVEIKRNRLSLNRPKGALEKPVTVAETITTHSSLSKLSVADFWALGAEVEKLSYFIKADELPSAILQYLEPLPLSGLEDEIHPLLEIAYAHIAKRAQVYGLGL